MPCPCGSYFSEGLFDHFHHPLMPRYICMLTIEMGEFKVGVALYYYQIGHLFIQRKSGQICVPIYQLFIDYFLTFSSSYCRSSKLNILTITLFTKYLITLMLCSSVPLLLSIKQVIISVGCLMTVIYNTVRIQILPGRSTTEACYFHCKFYSEDCLFS